MKKREVRLGLLSILFGIILFNFVPVSVYADRPAGLPETYVCSEHSDRFHFYTTGNTYTKNSKTLVEGVSFGISGSGGVEFYDGCESDSENFESRLFKETLEQGWYFQDSDHYYHKCSGACHSAFSSVVINFNNSNVAGATWDDISSNILVTTSPQEDLTMVSGSIFYEDSEFSDALVAGNSYRLKLMYKSANNGFSQDGTITEVSNVKGMTASETLYCTDGSGTVGAAGLYLKAVIDFTVQSSSPSPTPTPSPKKDGDNKQEGPATDWYGEFLKYNAKSEIANDKSAKKPSEIVDRDTFKSEVPSKTVLSTDVKGAEKFLDLKVHAADERTKLNQQFLCNALVRPNAQIFLTENIYPGRALSIAENGSLETLTWNNLPKNQSGPVYAVIYNQTDGAYVVPGTLEIGVATFAGFRLREASTITICR